MPVPRLAPFRGPGTQVLTGKINNDYFNEKSNHSKKQNKRILMFIIILNKVYMMFKNNLYKFL
jgi:hypothetical protein